ncbi:MAG TPA: hypothetical protein VMV49_18400 [Candidatus Deferrimicrobium sp.]|nr:hypothetical protein [Candidatus Deferrimicrobium sp.]
MVRIKFREFDDTLNFEGFACGNDEIDDFLKNKARINDKTKFSKIYTFTSIEDDKIIAYFTLSVSQINIGDARIFGKNNVLAILLGQLGVDNKYKGRNLGKKMIGLAVEKAYQASKIVANRLLLVETPIVNREYYLHKINMGFELIKYDKKRNLNILYIDLLKYERNE